MDSPLTFISKNTMSHNEYAKYKTIHLLYLLLN